MAGNNTPNTMVGRHIVFLCTAYITLFIVECRHNVRRIDVARPRYKIIIIAVLNERRNTTGPQLTELSVCPENHYQKTMPVC